MNRLFIISLAVSGARKNESPQRGDDAFISACFFSASNVTLEVNHHLGS